MLQSINNFKKRLVPYYNSLWQRIKQSRGDWQHPEMRYWRLPEKTRDNLKPSSWFKSSPDPRESDEYKEAFLKLKKDLRKLWDVWNKKEENKDIKLSEDEIDTIVTDEAVNLMQIYWHNRMLTDSIFTPKKVGEIIERERELMHEIMLGNKDGLQGGKRKTAKSNTKNVVKKSKNVNNAKKPAAKKPAAKKPAAKKPAAKKPTAKKPTAKKPAAKKPAAKKPAAKKPAAKKPATKKPTAKKSATAKSKSKK